MIGVVQLFEIFSAVGKIKVEKSFNRLTESDLVLFQGFDWVFQIRISVFSDIEFFFWLFKGLADFPEVAFHF